jgi:NAD(P)H-dependent flavin oxidoreductase YrpB (nitropropane dioxygenase family)
VDGEEAIVPGPAPACFSGVSRFFSFCIGPEAGGAASGGIADGRAMAAALALGADGVNMGTRFCATTEAPIHDHVKQALVRASKRDTHLIFRTFHNTRRALKNATERRPGGCEFAEMPPLVSGQRGRAALRSGDVHGGLVWAGQAVGLVNDIPSRQELIARMVMAKECREALAQASARHVEEAHGSVVA